MPLLHHVLEETDVGPAASAEGGVEPVVGGGEGLALDKGVTGPRVGEVHDAAGGMGLSLAEPAPDHPAGASLFKVRAYRPYDPVGLEFLQRHQHAQEPPVVGELIVVDEGDVVPASLRDRLVPGKGDVLFGLDMVLHEQMAGLFELQDRWFCGPGGIVVNDHCGIGKDSLGLLPLELYQ